MKRREEHKIYTFYIRSVGRNILCTQHWEEHFMYLALEGRFYVRTVGRNIFCKQRWEEHFQYEALGGTLYRVTRKKVGKSKLL